MDEFGISNYRQYRPLRVENPLKELRLDMGDGMVVTQNGQFVSGFHQQDELRANMLQPTKNASSQGNKMGSDTKNGAYGCVHVCSRIVWCTSHLPKIELLMLSNHFWFRNHPNFRWVW